MSNKKIISKIEVMKRNSAKAEAMLKLLANAKRLLVLCHLLKGEQSVGQLADSVGLSQSAISQHLAKMRESGLIDYNKKGQEVYYRIINHEVEAILSTLYLIYCK